MNQREALKRWEEEFHRLRWASACGSIAMRMASWWWAIKAARAVSPAAVRRLIEANMEYLRRVDQERDNQGVGSNMLAWYRKQTTKAEAQLREALRPFMEESDDNPSTQE